MKAIDTSLDGVLIIEPKLLNDPRGWFMETYSLPKMAEIGIDVIFVQDNHSYSKERNVIRGLHFQNMPMGQSKLVRCTIGSILDVAVDIRKGSPTYLKWIKVELSSANKRQFFIPRGFAHGFLTLEDETEVQYKVDNIYSREHDRVIKYDDQEIGIDWGVKNPNISERDNMAPRSSGCDNNFVYNSVKHVLHD